MSERKGSLGLTLLMLSHSRVIDPPLKTKLRFQEHRSKVRLHYRTQSRQCLQACFRWPDRQTLDPVFLLFHLALGMGHAQQIDSGLSRYLNSVALGCFDLSQVFCLLLGDRYQDSLRHLLKSKLHGLL